MPVMTKEQYREAGRKAKAHGAPPAATMSAQVTWQSRAYMEGYGEPIGRVVDLDAPTGRMTNSQPELQQFPPVGHSSSRGHGKSALHSLGALSVKTTNWPQAAREHFLRLTQDMLRERNIVRLQRLQRAIKRMTKRHSGYTPASFPFQGL